MLPETYFLYRVNVSGTKRIMVKSGTQDDVYNFAYSTRAALKQLGSTDSLIVQDPFGNEKPYDGERGSVVC